MLSLVIWLEMGPKIRHYLKYSKQIMIDNNQSQSSMWAVFYFNLCIDTSCSLSHLQSHCQLVRHWFYRRIIEKGNTIGSYAWFYGYDLPPVHCLSAHTISKCGSVRIEMCTAPISVTIAHQPIYQTAFGPKMLAIIAYRFAFEDYQMILFAWIEWQRCACVLCTIFAPLNRSIDHSSTAFYGMRYDI